MSMKRTSGRGNANEGEHGGSRGTAEPCGVMAGSSGASEPAPCSHGRRGKTLRHAPFMSMKRTSGRGNANEGEHGGSRGTAEPCGVMAEAAGV